MAPFDLTELGTPAIYAIYFAIGIGFGATLEMSGFGDSRKLAAQFYLKDMTVLKVMFTAIITAMTLIFFSSALGLTDFTRIFVNHTYLMPGIVGGLIMGVGFIVGGFCPGTSIVAASTLKLDGMVFVIGVTFGVFAFGESVHLFEDFWNSSYYGRFTIPDWLHVSYGAAVLGVIAMALMMFYGGEIAERIFGQGQKPSQVRLIPQDKRKIAAAGVLVFLAVTTLAIGQPDSARRWERISSVAQKQLDDRAIYIHPGEVVELKQNTSIYVDILDVRSESDYNLFHIMGAKNVDMENVDRPEFLRKMSALPDNTVTFIVSNGEGAATEAWKKLRAYNISNIYIVEGGYNNWLSIYKPDPCIAIPIEQKNQVKGEGNAETLSFSFLQAVGERAYAAHPDCACKEFPTDCFMATHPNLQRPTISHNENAPKVDYERKVKLLKKTTVKGGCG
jgi:rhodanese-related sulfurtransferase